MSLEFIVMMPVLSMVVGTLFGLFFRIFRV
jgi:hypothetical protein